MYTSLEHVNKIFFFIKNHLLTNLLTDASRSSFNTLQAIRAIEQCKIEDDDDEMNQKKVLITLYRNMAACKLKVEKYKETTSFCDLVIHIDSKDVKAHFLKAKVCIKN